MPRITPYLQAQNTLKIAKEAAPNAVTIWRHPSDVHVRTSALRSAVDRLHRPRQGEEIIVELMKSSKPAPTSKTGHDPRHRLSGDGNWSQRRRAQ